MRPWCLSYLFGIQRGLLAIKRLIWHHWHFHIEPAVFFGLCMNTFMETYLLQGLNLSSAARSTLSLCTVGSVSHPSRCHRFDFREGRCWPTVPWANVLFDSENFLLRGVGGWGVVTVRGGKLQCQDTGTQLHNVWHVNQKWRCRKSALPPLQDRRRRGLTALPTLWKYRDDLTRLQDSTPTSVPKKKEMDWKRAVLLVRAQENVLYNNVSNVVVMNTSAFYLGRSLMCVGELHAVCP